MNGLNLASIIFAVLGGGIGFWAAYYWLKASEVPIDPGWRRGLANSPEDLLRQIEPVEPEQSQTGWIVALIEAAGKSAALNTVAARLTAVAVLLSAVSAILGALAGVIR